MSKNAIIGVAIALSAVAAGFGAFFALRPASVVSVPSVTASSASSPAALEGGSGSTSGTAGYIPDSSTGAVVASAAAAAPVPAPEAAPAAAPAAIEINGNRTTPAAQKPKADATAAASTKPARASAQQGVQAPADAIGAGLDKPWPGGTAAEPPVTPPVPVEQLVATPSSPPVPPEPQFQELVVPADSVLGLRLESTVNSETARLEDPVEAQLTRDVRVGARVAVPAGTRVLGSVTQVEQGGKMKTKARLAVRFHTLVLADGTRTRVETDAIYREGESPGQEAAGKMGAAAAGGAILGAILGGKKGAAIGGSIGAAGGAATVMAGRRNPAVLQAGTAVTVRLQQPVGIVVER